MLKKKNLSVVSEEPRLRVSKAKRAALQAAWEGDARKSSIVKLMQGACSELSKTWGEDSVALLGDAGLWLIGIPFPSFCLEYLFQLSAFPLGRISQVVGTEATCKSAFCFEVVRWFWEYAFGPSVLLEHESKFSASWFRSIVGWDEAAKDSNLVIECDSMDIWQSRLLALLQYFKKLQKGTAAEPGPGKVWPAVFVIDSIMGKLLEKSQEAIDKVGSAGPAHPREALSLSRFMAFVPQKIRSWPFVILGVNHLKPKTTEQGIIERNKPGGRSVSFQETFEIELARGPGFVEHKAAFEARNLRLTIYKNSMAPDRRSILTRLQWTKETAIDAATGKRISRQESFWNWHLATVKLLLDLQTNAKLVPSEKARKRIRELVGFQARDGVQHVWSKPLGISPKDPVSAEEAGQMLSQREDILSELRLVLGIEQLRAFDPAVDYDIQRKALKKEMMATRKKRVKQIVAPVDDEQAEDGTVEEASPIVKLVPKKKKKKKKLLPAEGSHHVA